MKITGKVVPMNAMQAYGGVEVYFQEFLTLALYGNEWFASCSGLFIPRGGKKRSRCQMNRKLDWPLIRFGHRGEEVSCHYQQSNHDTAQYLQYKLHNDLQFLRNFFCLRSQYCDYDVLVTTPCSLVEELFTLKMDKPVFPKH